MSEFADYITGGRDYDPADALEAVRDQLIRDWHYEKSRTGVALMRKEDAKHFKVVGQKLSNVFIIHDGQIQRAHRRDHGLLWEWLIAEKIQFDIHQVFPVDVIVISDDNEALRFMMKWC